MKRYRGTRTPAGCAIDVIDPSHPDCGYPLDPRFDLRRHSPTGYSWSYSGSGPAQTALALLADALGDDERAQDLYQDFKFRVVSRLPEGGWELTQAEIRDTAAKLEAARGRG